MFIKPLEDTTTRKRKRDFIQSLSLTLIYLCLYCTPGTKYVNLTLRRCPDRSNYHKCSIKKFRNNSQGNNCVRVSFLINLQDWSLSYRNQSIEPGYQWTGFYMIKTRPVALLKKRPWHWYFPVNFAKLLRAPFLQNTFGKLLLSWSSSEHRIYAQFTSCIQEVRTVKGNTETR